ncbi:UPF0538 protein C2orf76 homolog [Saccoglossus kowalevskii]|uniref:UPF0538 protein C2orf76 homolog n=1 Tax=Saccoglossus kowalevskii TaxID=10224 RepID=A0ABM0H0E6_SACKO|nr:PREDICTED: UPF0538 protein C2orf76 homolog [Saccoglossus kowalevskii]
MTTDKSVKQVGLTLTVRLIRSFQHRNIKPIVLQNVSGTLTAREFMRLIDKEIEVKPGIPPPVRKYKYDTLKILHTAHGFKSNNSVINFEDDEKLILKEDVIIANSGVGHETELSYFKLEDYQAYKSDPVTTW